MEDKFLENLCNLQKEIKQLREKYTKLRNENKSEEMKIIELRKEYIKGYSDSYNDFIKLESDEKFKRKNIVETKTKVIVERQLQIEKEIKILSRNVFCKIYNYRKIMKLEIKMKYMRGYIKGYTDAIVNR